MNAIEIIRKQPTGFCVTIEGREIVKLSNNTVAYRDPRTDWKIASIGKALNL